jgi:hypothetical protein
LNLSYLAQFKWQSQPEYVPFFVATTDTPYRFFDEIMVWPIARCKCKADWEEGVSKNRSKSITKSVTKDDLVVAEERVVALQESLINDITSAQIIYKFRSNFIRPEKG